MRLGFLACAAVAQKDEWRLEEKAATVSYLPTTGAYCKAKNIDATGALAKDLCAVKCGPGSHCETYPTDPDCEPCSGYIAASAPELAAQADSISS